MSVTTPRLTWGFHVDSTNCDIPFDSTASAGNRTGTMRYGTYTAEELATEAARAMNAGLAGRAFTCVYSVTDRKFTFDDGTTAFTLEWSRLTSSNAAGLFGFDEVDTASSAAGHTSTDTAGVAAGFFKTAGVYAWAPTDPIHANSPHAASGAGTAGTLLQRMPFTQQFRSDGGLRESIYFSTDKLVRLQWRWLTGDERTYMEAFLDWAVRGRRFMYQPSTSSTNYLVLMLRDPGEIAGVHEELTLANISYPELTFVEAVDRI